MKRLFLLFILPCFGFSAPFSLTYRDVCCPASRCAGFARLLYWNISIPPVAYVIQNGHIVALKPDYHLGLEVGGRLVSVNQLTIMEGSYTQLDSTVSGQATGEILNGEDGTAKAKLQVRYKTGYLAFGRYFYRGCDFGIYAFVGGRYTHIVRKDRLKVVGGNTGDGKAAFEGGGFEFGFKGESGSLAGFQGFGRFSFIGVIGKQTQRGKINGRVLEKTRSTTPCLPGFIFRGGVTLTRCGKSGWQVIFEAGYALDLYFQGITNAINHNIAFFGPYAGMKLRY